MGWIDGLAQAQGGRGRRLESLAGRDLLGTVETTVGAFDQ